MDTRSTSTRQPTTYRLGELFSGPGGLAVGAHLANIGNGDRIAHQWATDYDADTVKTYAANIPGASAESVVLSDIRELDYQVLHDLGDIDALAFGFPCNDFSVVGEQKGFNGEFGPLYTYGVKALKEFQPKWFLAENVGGLRSANEGAAFVKIQHDLREAGYKLVTNLYKFEQYGVPQARHRIIIIGIRDDIDRAYRVPSTEPFEDADVSVRTALTVPPITPDMSGTEKTRQSATVVERLKLIKPGQNAFTADLPEHLQIKTATKISQIYKRLHPDQPAYTVTGSGGGGTHMYHWDEPRALTNRERARLQTFPDDFNFHGSKEQVRKQIGMAVPAKGAQVIFEAVMKTMAGIDYPSQEANMD
ncbi:MAG: DNA (cytosine-5-)-methyltransferase [Actinomycetaceae bacterium]|nr:DNA (cytosine-5-)-methyltransferase [Actinomycetaceae bacterium]